MNKSKDFDYIIIGAGILSSIAYKFLIENGMSVKVVNLSGLPSLANKENNNFTFEEETLSYGVGGTSTIWASAFDFFPKNYLPNYLDEKFSQHNITKIKKFLKGFNIPIEEFEEINNHYSDVFIKDVDIENANFVIRNKELFKFSQVICREDILNIEQENFEINTETGEVKDKFKNNTYSYKKIIIAAGGIGNPYFLNKFISNNKNIGKNYMNHLKFVPVLFETKKYEKINKITGIYTSSNFEIFPTYPIKDSKTGLTHSFRIYTSLRKDIKKVSLISEIFDKVGRKLGYSKFFKVLIYTDMKSQVNFLEFNDKEVILDTSKDETIYEINATIDRIYKLINNNKAIKHTVLKKNFSYSEGSHHMGTTSIGESSESSVVDTNLNLYGFKNIKVIGTSTLPKAGSGHPTLSSIILALVSLEQELQ